MIRGLGVDDGDTGVCTVDVLDVAVTVAAGVVVNGTVELVVVVEVVDVDDEIYFNCVPLSFPFVRLGDFIAFLTSVGASASTTVSNTSEPGNTGFFRY